MVNHTSHACARHTRCGRGRPPCLPVSFEGVGRRAIRGRAARAAIIRNRANRGTSIQLRQPGNHGGLPLRVAGGGRDQPGFSLDATPRVRAVPGAPNKPNLRVRPCGVETREAPNKPNFRRFWPENEAPMKNRANSATRDCFGASLLAMTHVRQDAGLPNKANFQARPPRAERRGMPNEANLRRREARDWRLGIADSKQRGHGMSNKANFVLFWA